MNFLWGGCVVRVEISHRRTDRGLKAQRAGNEADRLHADEMAAKT